MIIHSDVYFGQLFFFLFWFLHQSATIDVKMILYRIQLPTTMLIVCVFIVIVGFSDATTSQTNKPNIVIILADDMVIFH